MITEDNRQIWKKIKKEREGVQEGSEVKEMYGQAE